MSRPDDATPNCGDLSAATTVSLKALKQFALEKLPDDWPLKNVLLADDDEIPARELPSRAKVWLVLLRHRGRD